MFDLASLQQMWANAWPVISVLLLCSVFSWAIILERWLSLRRAFFNREGLLDRLRKLFAEKRREQAIAYCETLKKPIGPILSVLIEPPPQDRHGRSGSPRAPRAGAPDSGSGYPVFRILSRLLERSSGVAPALWVLFGTVVGITSCLQGHR